MEKKLFRTLLKEEHELGCNPYVRGRVSGIMHVLCAESNKRGYAIACAKAGDILTTECTEEQYREFAGYVEDLYPGLCVFDYK